MTNGSEKPKENYDNKIFIFFLLQIFQRITDLIFQEFVLENIIIFRT